MTAPTPETPEMSGSALTFRSGEQLGTHPLGCGLAGAVRSGSDEGSFVGGDAASQGFGAGVVDARSSEGCHASHNTGLQKVLTRADLRGYSKAMTTTATWTHSLSMDDLYVITSNTTCEAERREALAEIDRRDECEA